VAIGVTAARKEGEMLTGVAWRTAKYVDGRPDEPSAVEGALPFSYQPTGARKGARDPQPRTGRAR
jgi:hypothetical protein